MSVQINQQDNNMSGYVAVCLLYLSCQICMLHHLVSQRLQQFFHVLFIFLSSISVQAMISEIDISDQQSHTTPDCFFGHRVNL